MDYQLVLQMQGESLADFDALIQLEDELRVRLRGIADVDGHDMGCNEVNIFILTSDPVSVFTHAMPVLERRGLLPHIRSAYRLLTGDSYTNIWPETLRAEFVVA